MYNDFAKSIIKSRAFRAGILLISIILFGTIGFMWTQEDWGIWKSIYFTLITITTVGYSDYELNDTGQKFTLILLLFGIVTATYAFTQIMQAAVSYHINWQKRTLKMITKLNQHHIICGFGRVGSFVCQQLKEANIPFVLIDKDPVRCQKAQQSDYLVIEDSATDDYVLEQAGIEKAQSIVCTVDNDIENIIITMTARELNENVTIISRVDDEGSRHKVQRAGATHVISPFRTGGEEITTILTKPHLSEFLNHSDPKEKNHFSLKEISIKPEAALVGQKIIDYVLSEPSLVFVALKRGDEPLQIRPCTDTVLQADDTIVVAGNEEALGRMETVAHLALIDLVAAGAR
jgi:voltage-gated potassium channel